jgi:hypothetical protein
MHISHFLNCSAPRRAAAGAAGAPRRAQPLRGAATRGRARNISLIYTEMPLLTNQLANPRSIWSLNRGVLLPFEFFTRCIAPAQFV